MGACGASFNGFGDDVIGIGPLSILCCDQFVKLDFSHDNSVTFQSQRIYEKLFKLDQSDPFKISQDRANGQNGVPLQR